MSAERFLVTGALGCIGAWTVRELIREGVPVFGFYGGTRWSACSRARAAARSC